MVSFFQHSYIIKVTMWVLIPPPKQLLFSQTSSKTIATFHQWCVNPWRGACSRECFAIFITENAVD